MVGDNRRIELPDFKRIRVASGRFRGLRCVHTHLRGEPLTQDDLTDLALLRLDLMAAIDVDVESGLPGLVRAAHLLTTRCVSTPDPCSICSRRTPKIVPVAPVMPTISRAGLVCSMIVELFSTKPDGCRKDAQGSFGFLPVRLRWTGISVLSLTLRARDFFDV